MAHLSDGILSDPDQLNMITGQTATSLTENLSLPPQKAKIVRSFVERLVELSQAPKDDGIDHLFASVEEAISAEQELDVEDIPLAQLATG